MRFRGLALLLGLALLVLCPSKSWAQPSWLSEMRVGVLDHDIPLGGHHKEKGVDGNLEVLFASPSFLAPILRPRPVLGIVANSANKTNYGYAGLTWGVRLAPRVIGLTDAIFLTGTLGGAVHDGSLDIPRTSPLASSNKSLGSRALFREAAEVGYEFMPRNSISVMLDHISNARLAKRNEGITNVGVRYGIRF